MKPDNCVRREIRYVGGKQKRNGWVFPCRDCGRHLWVPSSTSLHRHIGRCISCHGKHSIRRVLPRNRGARLRPFEALLNRLISTTKGTVNVSLTYEEFLRFTEIKECHYCGRQIEWTPYHDGKTPHPSRTNLDRKNSSRGYEVNNLVVACIVCNRSKSDHLSYEEMMQLSPYLRQIKKEWVETRVKHTGYPFRNSGRRNLRPFEWLYNRLRWRASRRGLPCSLNFEQFLRFTEIDKCHYCGNQVIWIAHNGCKHKNMSINLDRKNSVIGYESENLVVACAICNRIKNSYFSYEDMMVLSEGLQQIRAQREGTV